MFGDDAHDRARGFQGRIVPVNPNADEILGLEVCHRVDDLDSEIDLAIYAIPAAGVPEALDTAARRGVGAAIVLSAGFFEMGAEGRRLEAQLRSVAKNTGVRLIGPNCTGVFSQDSNLQASFFSAAPFPGPIAFISQSGAIAQAVCQYSHAEAIGLSHVVSIGDKVDVDDAELIRYFARNEQTKVIALYVESLDDPRAFYEAARQAAPHKAIVVLRGGATGAGHRAAKVHEGILGISDSTLDGALTHPGIHKTSTLSEFLAAARALAYQPPATGRRIAVVTNGGGAGVLAADAVSRAGMDIVRLTPQTTSQLSKIVQNPRAAMNPVDLLGDANPEQFLAALKIVAACEQVDAILVALTDQSIIDPMEVGVQICEWAPTQHKPIVASFVGLTGQQSENYVERHGVPEYDFPELAAQGLRALVARGNYLARLERGQIRRTRSTRKHLKRTKRW